MVVRQLIKKQTYFDSVTLMLIGSEVKKMEGIENTVVGMCTDYNIDSLKRLNMYSPEFDELTPNDLIICVSAKDEQTAELGIAEVQNKLQEKGKRGEGSDEYASSSQKDAVERMPDANISLISVPGEYAAIEAEKALNEGRHVMLFSDNVSIEDELRLKEIGEEKALLVMGPDCGTAIINGTALAFANKVTKGNIGLVAASGTGLQEVTSTISRFGYGVSQAIGVGGRDLSEKIGGKMTIMATRALAQDPATKVIVLISKPPAEAVLEPLFKEFKNISKPVVVYFIGADPALIEKQGFVAATNLEDAAIKACNLAGTTVVKPEVSDEEIAKMASEVKLQGKYLRGLYSGGTLCDEAQRLLQTSLVDISSNTPVKGCKAMTDIYNSQGHSIIDLGDDDFTRGKAHPMIDPSYRCERLVEEAKDPDTAIIIFDLVIGYGSHPDIAGEMADAIEKARHELSKTPVFAASICGTKEDLQGYDEQKAKLEKAGVRVFPTNIALVKFAQQCLKRS